MTKIKISYSRDQIILLFAAFNEIMLGLDVYLAHLTSGEILPYEWIPIIFGPAAGVGLLIAGIIALRKRTIANLLATGVFFASMLVGVLGSYFHLIRASIPAELFGRWFSLDMLVWAPPILGPISFAGIALLGLSAAWIESPPDSGKLLLIKNIKLQLPYSKTRGFLLLLSFGILTALISSTLDHARTGFSNTWLWLPLVAGVFALIVTVYLGFIGQPQRSDIMTYVSAMLLLMAVGVVGAVLHVQADLTSQSQIVVERFLRGAPIMAPLQFANLGMLGIIILLDPKEK
ncbi:MAG: hypothetical protein N2C13_02745 [Chloroflexota bacterium]